MARAPSKRWVEMVEKFEFDPNGATIGHLVITSEQAATLLSRQHSAFVRMVKRKDTLLLEHAVKIAKMKRPQSMTNDQWDATKVLAVTIVTGQRLAYNDLLAALQQGGKK